MIRSEPARWKRARREKQGRKGAEMGVFGALSEVSRRKKLQMFLELMRPSRDTTILDVGAQVSPRGTRGLQFIDSYPWKDQITAINLSPDHVGEIQQHYPQVEARVADACQLPWPDKHFDIAYSNAVIEHVGEWRRQRQMASEIMRVAKAWFVTTPNRWYPYEFHLRLPFVTWLPAHGYRWVGAFFGYDHVRHRYRFCWQANRGLRLLSARMLHQCFPDGRVVAVRVTFWPETLIAAGPHEIWRWDSQEHETDLELSAPGAAGRAG